MIKTQEEKMKDRDTAIMDARDIVSHPYFVLDTETTGLKNAQMCQIAILHSDGRQFKSLVHPTIPIEPGASQVHRITNEDVEHSPSALEVIRKIPEKTNMVIYNAPFDLEIIKNSLSALGMYGGYHFDNLIYDAMRIYSNFDGEWNDYFENYKWHKLIEACRRCGIDEENNAAFHDALYDVSMTDRLIHYIAKQKLSSEA
jgi:DNA polymerase III subunit epsilon